MVSSRSIRSLSSRRYDSRCSSVQSSGIGVIEKNAFWPLSSGPGELSIAPPNARRKTGVQRISSGSSARPIRSRSRQNASIRAISARQKSSSSSAARVLGGDRVEDAADERRRRRRASGGRRAPRRPQLAGEPDHLGPDGHVVALGRPRGSAPASAPSSASCGASSRRTARGRAGPRPRSPGRTTSRRCASNAASAARAVSAAAREARQHGGDRGSSGGGLGRARARRRSAPSIPGSCASAVSVWNRETGRPGVTDDRSPGGVDDVGQALEPSGDRGEPLGERRELPGEQREQAVAEEVDPLERVPGLLAELGLGERGAASSSPISRSRSIASSAGELGHRRGTRPSQRSMKARRSARPASVRSGQRRRGRGRRCPSRQVGWRRKNSARNASMRAAKSARAPRLDAIGRAGDRLAAPLPSPDVDRSSGSSRSSSRVGSSASSRSAPDHSRRPRRGRLRPRALALDDRSAAGRGRACVRWFETALANADAGHGAPVRDRRRARPAGPIGSSRFLSIVPEHRRLEIGWTWIGHGVPADRRQPRGQAAPADPCVRDARREPGRVQDRLAQRAVADRPGRDRGDVRGRLPQPHDHARRVAPALRLLQRHRRGVAGREGPPRRRASIAERLAGRAEYAAHQAPASDRPPATDGGDRREGFHRRDGIDGDRLLVADRAAPEHGCTA